MRKKRFLSLWYPRVLVLLGMLIFSACQSDGYQGRAYVREADGSIGPTIRGVSITFVSEDGTASRTRTTDENGWYRAGLDPARYRVTAEHVAYEPYDSSPGFFVVTGDGFQTGNIFLHRLEATVVMVVRHAEKASTAPNTNLAPDPDELGIGVGRADALGGIAADAGVAAVYSPEYCRTAQTAQPTAADLGLVLQVIAASNSSAGLGNCDPAITVSTASHPAALGNPTSLVAHILTEHAGEVVLVVGHSNTVPQIITALGAPSPCPAYLPGTAGNCLIPETEFNHLFVVTVPQDGSAPLLAHELYGAP